MDEAQAACYPNAVRSAILVERSELIRRAPSVLNTFKTMVTDDDLLEKDDLYILDRMKIFVSNSEVANFAAAKQLLILIERAVRSVIFSSFCITL